MRSSAHRPDGALAHLRAGPGICAGARRGAAGDRAGPAASGGDRAWRAPAWDVAAGRQQAVRRAKRWRLVEAWSAAGRRTPRSGRPGRQSPAASARPRRWPPRLGSGRLTDPKTARSLYRQSLAHGRRPARGARRPDGAARPTRPRSSRPSSSTDRVQLRWIPPEPDGLGPLSFVVLRKRGGPLAHLADGTRIAKVSATEFEDTKVIAGETVSYAVLSKRGKAESITAATTDADPPAGRGGRRPRRGRGATRSTCPGRPPRGRTDVRVVRKREGAPTGPKDGDLVPSLRDRAHDRGLQDDQVYHYGLFALYRDARRPPGAVARGLRLGAGRTPPVAIPDAPTLTHEPGGRLRLDWPAPPRGAIKVVRTARPLPHVAGPPPGRRRGRGAGGPVARGRGPRRGDRPEPSPARGLLLHPAGRLGRDGDGRPRRHLLVHPRPLDLRATRVGGGGRVHLRWRWSPRGTQALIVARSGAPPRGPDDPRPWWRPSTRPSIAARGTPR